MAEPIPFWVVWCPQGSSPTVKHLSRAEATREAERLAAKHPGHEFFVLRPATLICLQTVKVTLYSETGPAAGNMPF